MPDSEGIQMRRWLPLLVSLAVCTGGPLSAQCFTATGSPVPLIPESPSYAATDEGMTAELPLGFTFPMAGVGYPVTHCVIDANGEVYLTDGQGVVNPSNFGTAALATLRGGPGGSARVMAMGGDNTGPHPTSEILVDTSVAGSFKVTWVDWSRFGGTADWDCSVTLSDDGNIRFDYSQGFVGCNIWDYVGVSIGDDVGSPFVPPSNLAGGGDSGTLGLVYENTWPPFDLEFTSVVFAPNGVGGYSFSRTCLQVPANHVAIGTGCYDVPRQCVYESFVSPAQAQNALQGQAISFAPTGYGYSVAAAAASYIAPTANAIDLLLGDEAEANVTPSVPFTFGAGAVATLSVCSNGFVNLGPTGGNTVLAHGSIYDMVHSPVASFRSNADFDPSANGAVFAEEVGGLLIVSWHDVYRFGGATPERLQMQFDLISGVVTMVWDQLTGAGSGPMVVGYAPGPSMDPGPTDLSAAMPVVTGPDVAAMSMSAAPAPISTATAGTQVVYQIDDIPDANGNSGVFFGMTMLTLLAAPAPIELSSIGMPDCRLYLATMDVTLPFLGATPTQTTVLPLPPGVPAGALLFAQSVALVFPNSLPNGQNAFGAVTSNALRSQVNSF